MNSSLMTLPENWQNNQIIAPSGREVGLSDQHGFNYLMKAVNDAHRACNRLREDNERLREELENKASMGSPQIYQLELSDGIHGPISNHENIFYKDCENRVHVELVVNCADGCFKASTGHIIATLPPGFIPKSYKHNVGYGLKEAGAGNTHATLVVNPLNGNIIMVPAENAQNLQGQINFIAFR